MSIEEAVAAFDAIETDDCEGAHSDADELLLSIAPPEIQAAYERVVERCMWWACA